MKSTRKENTMKAMFWKSLAIPAAALGLLAAGCGEGGREPAGRGDTVAVGDTSAAAQRATYVTSGTCLKCHADMAGWAMTFHKFKLRALDEPGATGQVFTNDWNQNGIDDFTDGLDFNAPPAGLTNPFAAAAALGTAPVLGKTGNTPWVKIGAVTYNVKYVLGGNGKWKQRYVTQIGASHYILPVQFNDGAGVDPKKGYVAYTAGDWYVGGTTPLYGAGETPLTKGKTAASYEFSCTGCHNLTKSVAQNAGGEWVMELAERNVGCEACHGPGSRHAASPAKDNIVNPATMVATRDLNGDGNVDQVDHLLLRNSVCANCHNRGEGHFAEAGGKKTEYPSRADAAGNMVLARPGDYWKDLFDATTTAFWKDGDDVVAAKSHRMQGLDIDLGPHQPDKAYDAAVCFACHNVHRGVDQVRAMMADKVRGVTIPVTDGVADANLICLACHATHGPFSGLSQETVRSAGSGKLGAVVAVEAAVTGHTQHPVDKAGCVDCHMPLTAKSGGINDIKSHTFAIIAPALSKSGRAVGVPNACSACHPVGDTAQLDALQARLEQVFRDETLELLPFFDQWSVTGKADPQAEAWKHYDWARSASRASCQRCHTTTGAGNYFRSPSTYNPATNNFAHLPSGWPAEGTYEVLGCFGCHEPKSTKLYEPGAFTADYGYVSGGLNLPVTEAYPDVKASNLCLACHAGRQSGDTIKAVAANGTLSFGNLSFVNSHYLTAGGSVFGATGYEFPGQSYTSLAYLHDKVGTPGYRGGANGPCVGCHMTATGDSHGFLPVAHDASHNVTAVTSPICAECHVGGLALTAARMNTLKDGMKEALKALEAALKAKGIYYANSHPYFFKSATDSTSANAVKNWGGASTGPNTMGAAFNYNMLAHDPGAYAHNQPYAKRLVFDALDWLDNGAFDGVVDLSGNLSAAAYLKATAPAAAVTRP